VNIIEVGNINETIEKIAKNGCSIVIPKRTIPGVGTVAYFRDTEGLLAGILEPVAVP
jgi:predicted enzyme related to lactoylglutathione lyase